MKVSILTMRDYKEVLAGAVTLVGDRLMVSVEPGFDNLMETVMKAQVLVNKEHVVDAVSDPKLWLRNLPTLYTGTMVRAQRG